MKNTIPIFITVLLSSFILPLLAQDHITIKGKVIDKSTNEGLPFATVSFVGNQNVGTITDYDGFFVLDSKWGTDSIMVSYVGYQVITKKIQTNVNDQVLNFEMRQEGYTLATAEIKSKKGKYRRKDNPAVELIQKVIAHKGKNRMQGQDFYEYDKYEKMELSLNNITDKFRSKRQLKNFQFMFDYVDTSTINGKPFLPIYIRETVSKVYFRKNPKHEKEYRSGVKLTELDKWVNTENMSLITDRLFQKIDIYENNIYMMGKQFPSSLAKIVGNAFYRFYIMDTILYNGMEVIDLAFMPADKQDIGFKGNLYIKNDTSYAVVKADFGVSKDANINWVNDLELIQEFTLKDSFWILSKDQIIVDFAITKKSKGMFGKRTVMYENFLFNKERDKEVYTGAVNLIEADDAFEQQDSFWTKKRQEPLSKSELGIYEMADSLQHVPSFKRAMNVLSAVVSGYWNFGNYEMGPVGSFYSFNDVEGFRLRFGGTTTRFFNPKVKLEGYAAYGFKDRQWKYAGAVLYSFGKDFTKFPNNYLRLSFQHETNFVGQKLDFVVEDNFLLSFKRGDASKMLFLDTYLAEYVYETNQDITAEFSFKHQKQRPLGSLALQYYNAENLTELLSIDQIRLSEFKTKIRWAPNQQFVQGHNFRHPIYNQYPIFTLEYSMGIKGLLGGQYSYHRVYADVFKRFHLPFIGMTDIILEGGKNWSKGMPYYMLFLPRANQTFSYKHRSYNLMNYLEFTNDAYLSWNIEHYFNGFIFNKIPLLKKLKLREVITFKGVWGTLSNANNPDLNPSLIQFTKNNQGQVETTSLKSQPYMEASFGVLNIFKVGRLDLVKRLSYLKNSNVPSVFGIKGLGIRFMLRFEF